MPSATPPTPVTPPGADRPAPRRCPGCGAAAPSGRFCTDCGASIEGGLCTACRSQLEAGAKFCHRCGAAVGGAVPPFTGAGGTRSLASAVPWAIAALVVVGLIAFTAGRNLGGGWGRSESGAQQDEASGGGDVASAPPLGGAPGRAPDISNMSPRERADRLYDRVMRLSEEGKGDSVAFFAPMVTSAYQMLGPLDLDEHYDLGRIAEVTGATALARAEVDTILRAHSTHLLGLVLAARLAVDARQPATARSYYQRLVAALPAEQAKQLPEYQRHQHDITTTLDEARKAGIAAGIPAPSGGN